jgi:hypothetical protein
MCPNAENGSWYSVLLDNGYLRRFSRVSPIEERDDGESPVDESSDTLVVLVGEGDDADQGVATR